MSIEGRDVLSPLIRQYREAFAMGEGLGGKAVSGADLSHVDETLKVSFADHASYQEVQTWAHASGLISAAEASIIYRSLGEVGSASNGGWAKPTDLAVKVVVTQLLASLLEMKLNPRGLFGEG